MLIDVYYYGNKPNVHPREKFATSLEDARKQCTTEHFWIINEFCDYRKFDWDWNFEFLPDEDVWAKEHNNIWPSQHQKDSGTWLCTKELSEVLIYRADVEPIPLKNKKWKINELVDMNSVDFNWIPDPHDPPYIYTWGSKHVSAELYPALEYYAESATDRKYMGLIQLLPQWDRWIEYIKIDKTSFDLTWRPDPREPPYIYVWGNKHIPAEVNPTLEYHNTNATERKYMGEIEVLPEFDKWNIVQEVANFDYSWRPDPREPPYIYVWGNKHISAELKSTIEYHVPTATEKKYMAELVEVLPELDRWKEIQPIDKSKFDLTWRPDPREPAYIYVWGNKHIPAELKSTIEYHCPNATEKKYIAELVEVLPQWDRYKVMIPVETTSFDFTWRPDPREPPYIYVWGNQSNSAEKEPTVEYHVPNATERKYMSAIVKTLPIVENWKILIPVENFDFSWRPDPHSIPYIYVFGNQWYDAMTEPTIEYHVPGAVDRKFITDIIALVTKTQENWKTLIPIATFDYSWRPNPHSTPYIYVFGNQWNASVIEPTIEYCTPGAIDKKYIEDVVAILKSTSTDNTWKRLISIESFDYSWRPDPNSPPYIYVFGNKWNDAATEPTIEYYCQGATEYKYMTSPVAVPQSIISMWSISNNDDLETFDFTWRPNPHSPPQIYQWADNGPRYTIPNATEVVLMERTGLTTKAIVNRYKIKTTLVDLIAEHPEEVFWAINPDLNYSKFDFSWRPTEVNFRHINVFGNEYSKDTQTYYINGPLYTLGNREFNYVEDQIGTIDSNLSMFYIDRGNKESHARLDELKIKYPQIQKTRYLNSWVNTIARCINKATTNLCWILNSELDYSTFDFDFYPSPWQMKMVHVFGTQWSHWGTTFMINKETFIEDTKYINVIEHLSNLNFVKQKRAKAINCIYDILVIDHGNKEIDNVIDCIEKKTDRDITVLHYNNSYFDTFKDLLQVVPIKRENYVWVCSSICDYTNFDFSYICDPFAKEQLHVFHSNSQQFGDTFLVNINKLTTVITEMIKLEDYNKINFNQHQRVVRLPAPVVNVTTDTHCDSIQVDFDFPYTIYATEPIDIIDNEPMNMWRPDTKTIIVASTGGSCIIVPKEAKAVVKKELYDYPYITKSQKLMKSKSMDIVFLSNGEANADENYEHLVLLTKEVSNRLIRISDINGRVASQHAAANASSSPWYFLVNGKLRVSPKFDFSWQPDRLQIPKHYIFTATNPLNGLEYGHQAIVANNKKLTLDTIVQGLDFTLDSEHEVININSGKGMFNSSEWDTWRTAFRETIKLRYDGTRSSKMRLEIWLTKANGNFAEYSLQGAKHAIEYYEEVNGDFDKLRLSYDWIWLQAKFNSKYKY